MSGFSETAVEDTPLEWLASLGYDVPYGPQIVADILPAQVTGTIWAVPNRHSIDRRSSSAVACLPARGRCHPLETRKSPLDLLAQHRRLFHWKSNSRLWTLGWR